MLYSQLGTQPKVCTICRSQPLFCKYYYKLSQATAKMLRCAGTVERRVAEDVETASSCIILAVHNLVELCRPLDAGSIVGAAADKNIAQPYLELLTC